MSNRLRCGYARRQQKKYETIRMKLWSMKVKPVYNNWRTWHAMKYLEASILELRKETSIRNTEEVSLGPMTRYLESNIFNYINRKFDVSDEPMLGKVWKKIRTWKISKDSKNQGITN